MSINAKEVGFVWVLKDLEFSTYEEGESLLHAATYGFYNSYQAAVRASKQFEATCPGLPQGNWNIHDEIVYDVCE